MSFGSLVCLFKNVIYRPFNPVHKVEMYLSIDEDFRGKILKITFYLFCLYLYYYLIMEVTIKGTFIIL